jgi:hypothetical protein
VEFFTTDGDVTQKSTDRDEIQKSEEKCEKCLKKEGVAH